MNNRTHISIIDCNVGNIGSVIRMVEKSGGTAERITTKDQVSVAEKIILPGVGHFDNGMKLLKECSLIEALKGRVISGNIPLLGICLGMQLLFDKSEEGNLPGLGFIPGKIIRFRSSESLPVPHMGWNEVSVHKKNPLISSDSQTKPPQRYYFVHSYHAICANRDDLLATTQYGEEVTAAVSRGTIYGVQFHPEKSHRFGMELISRFVSL